MASVTFSIPDHIKGEMQALSWVNWSDLAREEALKRAKLREDFERFKRIVSKSKLTEDDANRLSDEVNVSLSKRYVELLKRNK